MIREAGLGKLEFLGGETELRFNIYRKINLLSTFANYKYKYKQLRVMG